jgi:hypothetical protein
LGIPIASGEKVKRNKRAGAGAAEVKTHKAERRKRHQLITELNDEGSSEDAMRYRVPGSFESGRR